MILPEEKKHVFGYWKGVKKIHPSRRGFLEGRLLEAKNIKKK